jgi:hypothetical protein
LTHHHHHTVALPASPANDTAASTNAATDASPNTSTDDGTGMVAVVVLGYFLPTLIAALKKRPNAGAIFALNLLLGWTVFGWVIAFVWALTSTPPAFLQQPGK